MSGRLKGPCFKPKRDELTVDCVLMCAQRGYGERSSFHSDRRFGPVRAVAPGLVLDIAFHSLHRSTRHKSGVAMRFPRVHRIPRDKPTAEADELDRLTRLIDDENRHAPTRAWPAELMQPAR
ncbi:MAG: hypothetical protein IPM60_13675 [Rhodospirillales bacterium]|nr:hypothetical protein [Rhodospirillales bacterium]